MARALRDQPMTRADELRALLAESEKLAANLRTNREGGLVLLEKLDRIAQLWPELEALGVDLRPEAGRWETVQATVRANARHLLRGVKRHGGLPSLREKHHPAGDAAWWWYVAEETRKNDLRRLRRAAMILVGVVAVGILVLYVLNKLFPVPPEVRESMSRQLEGQSKIETDGDYEGALADFLKAAALTPDDPVAWLWVGCAQQKLGDEAAAARSFQRARELASDELSFRLSRAPILAQMGLWDPALEDLDAALAIDPENAQAHYLLAGVLEAQKRYPEALRALERASELAEAQGNPELTAMSRYRYAMMLQQMQASSLDQLNPIPSATP